jgi:hypothetical protein
MGLLVIDLRNRDLLRRYRPIGADLEIVDNGIYRARPSNQVAWFSILFFNDVELRGRWARLVSFQLGIDLIFTTVIAYAVYLLAR